MPRYVKRGGQLRQWESVLPPDLSSIPVVLRLLRGGAQFTLLPMQPSPQPHPQPKTLDDLLANAEHFADFCMRNSGSVTPALFFLGPDGQGMVCPKSLADDSAKDDFANHARLVCIAHAATACVMTLESWMKTAKADEKLDMTEAALRGVRPARGHRAHG